MDSHPAFYRYSLKEAVRHGEKDLWRESYMASCDCARAIERIIAENYDGERLGSHLAEPILDRYGFNRVNWVLANTIQQNPQERRFSPENRAWAKSFFIPQDDHNWQYAVTSHQGLTDLFVSQVREAWKALGLFDASHCEEDGRAQDYSGRVLILNPHIMKDQYKTPDDQLFLAKDGFGCSPSASGRKVFGEFLKDGEQTHFNRADFIGIIKEEYLPEWAREKLGAMAVPETEEEAPSDGMALR